MDDKDEIYADPEYTEMGELEKLSTEDDESEDSKDTAASVEAAVKQEEEIVTMEAATLNGGDGDGVNTFAAAIMVKDEAVNAKCVGVEAVKGGIMVKGSKVNATAKGRVLTKEEHVKGCETREVLGVKTPRRSERLKKICQGLDDKALNFKTRVSPTHSGLGPTYPDVCPTRAGVCLPQLPSDPRAAALMQPLPHPFETERGRFETERGVGLDGCVDAFPPAVAAIDGGGGGGGGASAAAIYGRGAAAAADRAARTAAPAMPVSSLAHQQRHAAISSLLKRLQPQAPDTTGLHHSVSPELRFELSPELSPLPHSLKPNPLVQSGSVQALARKPFTPNTSVPQTHAQHPFIPDSPQMQAAALRGSTAAQKSPPGGSMGFKSPSATPSPLSRSPRGGVGRAGAVAAAGRRKISGKSATEKQRRSRITERLEALKAAIPAEVLLRQQGRAGVSSRTQIAPLLDAAVGFIEGMREYKLELERHQDSVAPPVAHR
ncbi:unnamed protein product [Closterium sp. Naga37s-1]|nr:unnamed protein product [Closterium sp. Naga37s-1]